MKAQSRSLTPIFAILVKIEFVVEKRPAGQCRDVKLRQSILQTLATIERGSV
jgi:hypothetical protein